MSTRGAAVARGALIGGAVTASLGLLATAAGSGVAVHFARQVVTPGRHRPDDVVVLGADDDAVVLRADPQTSGAGSYGLEQHGGATHARIGRVLSAEPGRRGRPAAVRREVLGVDTGQLGPGPGRWSGWYYTGDPTTALGLAHRDVLVRSDVGDLPAWEVPADPDVSGRHGVWAVLVHGRGATRAECLRALPLLHRLGVPALVPAYRNDAEAPASPAGRYGLGDTEWVDVEAAVLHAVGAGARQVVLFGWSMGGAIALSHLSRSWTADRVAALVLDGPVLDWRSVLDHHARLHGVPRSLGRYGLGVLGSPAARALVGVDGPVDLRRLDWVARAQELAVPLLVLHSDDDEFVPVQATRALAAARPDLVQHVPFSGAGHCREWNVDPDRWEREVARFLLDRL